MSNIETCIDLDDLHRAHQETREPTSAELANHYLIDQDDAVRRWRDAQDSVFDQ